MLMCFDPKKKIEKKRKAKNQLRDYQYQEKSTANYSRNAFTLLLFPKNSPRNSNQIQKNASPYEFTGYCSELIKIHEYSY